MPLKTLVFERFSKLGFVIVQMLEFVDFLFCFCFSLFNLGFVLVIMLEVPEYNFSAINLPCSKLSNGHWDLSSMLISSTND